MRTTAQQPVAEEIVPDEELLRVDEVDAILVRPDGYYWRAPDGRQEFGPFASVELALADMAEAGGRRPSPARRCRRPKTRSALPTGSTPTPAIRPRGFCARVSKPIDGRGLRGSISISF